MGGGGGGIRPNPSVLEAQKKTSLNRVKNRSSVNHE